MQNQAGNLSDWRGLDQARQGVETEIISEQTVVIIQWVILTFVSQVIDVFGVGANIINIFCFMKQGFKDPVNVSLLGLAVSDLGCLSTSIWLNICYTPAFVAADLPFDAIEVNYLTGGVPHAAFARISGWITAVITLERCLCITTPLKVKNVVTRKKVSVVIVSTYIILISTATPSYLANTLDLKFFLARNKTLIGLVSTQDREETEKVSYLINNVVIPFSAFLVIIICTILLVVKLQKKNKWRNLSTSAGQGDHLTDRNQRVAKMVVMVSTLFIACFIPKMVVMVSALFIACFIPKMVVMVSALFIACFIPKMVVMVSALFIACFIPKMVVMVSALFIACFIPVWVLFLAMAVEPNFFINGKYRNLCITIGAFSLVLESVNSSVNIFIYYLMSSKYRHVFRQFITQFRD